MEEEIIVGYNAVVETLKAETVSKVYLTREKYNPEMKELLSKYNVPYVFVEKAYISKMSETSNHQNICAMVAPITYLKTDELIDKLKDVENPLIIMLDEVTDVNNLGAIIRIIESFKVDGLVFNKRRSAQVTSKVSKISSGAINYVNVSRVTNLVATLKDYKKAGYFIGHLDMDGEARVDKVNFDMPLVIVVGGEDKGITDNIKKHSDIGISIPMYGNVNSLNVASATSILCYEKRRK